MSREIKFRVWDNINKVMDPVTYRAGEQFGHPSSSDWVAMQFTGLLDKNGREIYEGDVVMMEGDPDPAAGDPVRLCRVAYEGPSLMYIDLHRSNEDSVESIIGVCEQDEGAEVIGNIHEHEHLLNGE